MITGELKSQVDKIWETFWTNGISNPITVIEQFNYLLFIKSLDAEQAAAEKRFLELKVPVKNVFYAEDERELRWQSFKFKTPEQKFDLFTKSADDRPSVFEHMKNVGNDAGVFAKYMKGAVFAIDKPRLLDQVITLIDKIDTKDRDTLGDLYEYMLSKLNTSKRLGAFRTPRHIIRMMIDLVQPQQTDIICDPSCGTAGFLVGASEYMREHYKDDFFDMNFFEHFHGKMFNGLEVDPSMIRIAAMNMQQHSIKMPELRSIDALSKNNEISDAYTVILANPPFKGSLDYNDVESSLLQTAKTKKTEILFLSLMLRMLKSGGRAAVIVPDGVLFGSSKAHKEIRKEIAENHKLDAIISMPSGVFKPYAGVSTAVMLFTKTETGGTDRVWFYDMQAEGYTLDDKRSPQEANDIPDIIARYHNAAAATDRKRTDRSFLVPLQEIRDNDYDLSINRYKEIVYEEIEYAPVAEIIADIEALDKERQGVLGNLKKLIG